MTSCGGLGLVLDENARLCRDGRWQFRDTVSVEPCGDLLTDEHWITTSLPGELSTGPWARKE